MDAPEKQDSGALASADARDASEASHEAAASPTADDAAPQLGDVKLGLSSTFSASQPPPPDPAPALAPPTRWTFRYGPAYARPFTPAVQKWILLLATFSALMGPFAATMYSPALPEIQQDLNTTAALVNLTLTLGALITGVRFTRCLRLFLFH